MGVREASAFLRNLLESGLARPYGYAITAASRAPQMSMTSNTDMESLGYWFDPPDHPGALGHPRLTVILSEQPSRDHFDPERIELSATDAGSVERVAIAHPWYGPPHLRMVAGDINVIDRRGKSIDAFTFGGELDIEGRETSTLASMTSSAPILDHQHVGGLDVEGVLAEEFAILLAKRRAQGGEDLAGYVLRLTRLDPHILYAACLEALEHKLTPLARTGGETYVRCLQTVKREIGRLKENGMWPSPDPSLERLL